MSTKAEELANSYADAVATHRLESLYGTSKSYTLEKAQERDAAHEQLFAELRRLAAVEDELTECKAAYESQFKELHALKASIGEPVRYEWRWLNPAGVNASPEELEWKTPAPKNLESQQEFIDRLLSFRYNEKPVIGVRPLYAIKDKP